MHANRRVTHARVRGLVSATAAVVALGLISAQFASAQSRHDHHHDHDHASHDHPIAVTEVESGNAVENAVLMSNLGNVSLTDVLTVEEMDRLRADWGEMGPHWVCFDDDVAANQEKLERFNRMLAELRTLRYNLEGTTYGPQGDPVTVTWSFVPGRRSDSRQQLRRQRLRRGPQ